MPFPQQSNSYHNAGFSNNQELSPSSECILRRPVSCNIYPYETAAARGGYGATTGVEAWLSPRPLFKEVAKPNQQVSMEKCFVSRGNHGKKNEPSSLAFAQDSAGSFGPFETDIN